MSYHTNKNKHLSVELTLIQIVQLTVEGGSDSGGHGPKQAIKPVFARSVTAQQPQVAPVTSQSQSADVAASAAPQAAPQRATTPPAVSTCPGEVVSPPGAIPGAVRMAQFKEEKKVPVMKKSSLGLSVKRPQKEEEQQGSGAVRIIRAQTQQTEEDFIFSGRDLNYYQQEYAGRMPIGQETITMRMRNMRLLLLNDTTLEVVVDNETIAKSFTALIPNIQAYLRGSLKNRKVTITIHVSEATENVRAVSRVERFQVMARKNSALLQLKEEFGLELY